MPNIRTIRHHRQQPKNILRQSATRPTISITNNLLTVASHRNSHTLTKSRIPTNRSPLHPNRRTFVRIRSAVKSLSTISILRRKRINILPRYRRRQINLRLLRLTNQLQRPKIIRFRTFRHRKSNISILSHQRPPSRRALFRNLLRLSIINKRPVTNTSMSRSNLLHARPLHNTHNVRNNVPTTVSRCPPPRPKHLLTFRITRRQCNVRSLHQFTNQRMYPFTSLHASHRRRNIRTTLNLHDRRINRQQVRVRFRSNIRSTLSLHIRGITKRPMKQSTRPRRTTQLQTNIISGSIIANPTRVMNHKRSK